MTCQSVAAKTQRDYHNCMTCRSSKHACRSRAKVAMSLEMNSAAHSSNTQLTRLLTEIAAPMISILYRMGKCVQRGPCSLKTAKGQPMTFQPPCQTLATLSRDLANRNSKMQRVMLLQFLGNHAQTSMVLSAILCIAGTMMLTGPCTMRFRRHADET